MQTKCVNGVCNTVKKYLTPEETRSANEKVRANSEKIQKEVEARISEHKKKVDEIFRNF